MADGEASIPSGPLIDYAAEIPRRRAALERRFRDVMREGDTAGFDAYRRTGGAALRRFALHQALSDRFGPYWNHWPAAYRDPSSPEVRRAEAALSDAAAFHAWLQWRAWRRSQVL
mgnify:CR=1 FL=1